MMREMSTSTEPILGSKVIIMKMTKVQTGVGVLLTTVFIAGHTTIVVITTLTESPFLALTIVLLEEVEVHTEGGIRTLTANLLEEAVVRTEHTMTTITVNHMVGVGVLFHPIRIVGIVGVVAVVKAAFGNMEVEDKTAVIALRNQIKNLPVEVEIHLKRGKDIRGQVINMTARIRGRPCLD